VYKHNILESMTKHFLNQI